MSKTKDQITGENPKPSDIAGKHIKKALLLLLMIPLLAGCSKCVKRETGYFAQTKFGSSYYLSDNIDEASKMYNGLIIKREDRCVEWSN